mmetsp:Transcript_8212/g.23489  ORF Transcript_8212/g.23489 Transcript_8212/m.23489 type:complete len:349 (+) Transcript_8212:648-1694(+)
MKADARTCVSRMSVSSATAAFQAPKHISKSAFADMPCIRCTILFAFATVDSLDSAKRRSKLVMRSASTRAKISESAAARQKQTMSAMNLALASITRLKYALLTPANCLAFQSTRRSSSSAARSVNSSSTRRSIISLAWVMAQARKVIPTSTWLSREANASIMGPVFFTASSPMRVSFSVAAANLFCAVTQSCWPRIKRAIFAAASFENAWMSSVIASAWLAAWTKATLRMWRLTPVLSLSWRACFTEERQPSSIACLNVVAVPTRSCNFRKKSWNSSLSFIGILPTSVLICAASSIVWSCSSSSCVSSTPCAFMRSFAADREFNLPQRPARVLHNLLCWSLPRNVCAT